MPIHEVKFVLSCPHCRQHVLQLVPTFFGQMAKPYSLRRFVPTRNVCPPLHPVIYCLSVIRTLHLGHSVATKFKPAQALNTFGVFFILFAPLTLSAFCGCLRDWTFSWGFGSGQPARKRVQQFNNFSMRGMALIGTDVFHQVRSLGKSAHHEQKTNQLSALSHEIIRCSTFEQIPLPTRVICKPF